MAPREKESRPRPSQLEAREAESSTGQGHLRATADQPRGGALEDNTAKERSMDKDVDSHLALAQTGQEVEGDSPTTDVV